MLLSSKSRYALHALLFLAKESGSGWTTVGKIADDKNIPKRFLDSILRELSRKGLLRIRRGRGGGYALARAADNITFGEIVRTTEGTIAPISCLKVNRYRACENCADEAVCEIRIVLKQLRDTIAEELDGTTLHDALIQLSPNNPISP